MVTLSRAEMQNTFAPFFLVSFPFLISLRLQVV
jgi:hypothetical protein